MKLSLKERLSQADCAERAGSLAGETISCFFQGVSLITGSKYPEWLSRRLRESYKIPGDYPYDHLVAHADKMICMEGLEKEGYELMYQLLIEPFYLMNEKEWEETL